MGTWLEALTGAVEAVNTAELDLDPGGPVRAALDPRGIGLPGVWVRFDGLAGPTLDCHVSGVLVTVFCVVASQDLERALGQAQELLALVADVIPPMSESRHVALAIPGVGTPATALSYTHQLTL